MSVLSPLNVKRFDKNTLYISITHISFIFFYTFQNLSLLFVKINLFFSQTENLEPPKPSKFINGFLKLQTNFWFKQFQYSDEAQDNGHSTWFIRSSEWISCGLCIPEECWNKACFTSHLLSFDNNKVLKIINWIC